MKRILILLPFLIIYLSIYCTLQAAENNDNEKLKNEIQEVFDDISSAFSELNVERVVSHFADNDMVKISGGVILRNKEELSEYLSKAIERLENFALRMDNIEFYIVNENYVLTLADEFITYNGKTHKAIVSNVFVKTDNRWQILRDHTSYVTVK